MKNSQHASHRSKLNYRYITFAWFDIAPNTMYLFLKWPICLLLPSTPIIVVQCSWEYQLATCFKTWSILSGDAMTETLTFFLVSFETEVKSQTTNATKYVLISTVSSNSSRTCQHLFCSQNRIFLHLSFNLLLCSIPLLFLTEKYFSLNGMTPMKVASEVLFLAC